MKTQIKKIAIAITMIIAFCGSVNAQDGIYFYNGATLVSTYRNISILGAAGDTITMQYIGNDTVRNVIWAVDNEYKDTTIEFKFVLQNDNTTPYSINTVDVVTNANLSSQVIWTKFSPTEYIFSDISGNKSESETLTLSNFNIKIHSMSPLCKAYLDSVYWYRNDTLVHEGTDTSYIAQTNGDYHIKIKNIYMNIDGYPIADTLITVRFEASNKVTISNIDTHVMNYFDAEKIKITVFPNPTTDFLNISEEINYTILSISGQEIIKGYGNIIDVSNFENGIYILNTFKDYIKFIIKK